MLITTQILIVCFLIVCLWMLIINLIRYIIGQNIHDISYSSCIKLYLLSYEKSFFYNLIIGRNDSSKYCYIKDTEKLYEDVINNHIGQYVQIDYIMEFSGIFFMNLTEKIVAIKKI